MNKEYHPALRTNQKESFPLMSDRLESFNQELHEIVDKLRKSKCNGLVSPLIFNLTEWLLSHLSGKGMLYARDFTALVTPILKQHQEDESVTTRTFGNKFYNAVARELTKITQKEVRKQKVEKRLEVGLHRVDRWLPRRQKQKKRRRLSKETIRQIHQMTEPVKDMGMSRIILLGKQSYCATRGKFLTAFCKSLLGEMGITFEMVINTHVTDTHPGDEHLIKKQVIKSVMSQLRLRVANEAVMLGIVEEGKHIPFSSQPRIFSKVGCTGKLIVIVDAIDGTRATHVDPVYYPMLLEIEKRMG